MTKKKIVNDADRILRSLEDGFLRADKQGYIIMANETIAGMCGYSSSAEMIGVHMKKLYADPQQRDHLIKEIKEKGKLLNCELELLRKDGSRFWSLNNIKTFSDEKGNLLGTEGVIRDITKMKQMEENLEHANKVLAAIRNVNQLITVEKDTEKLLQGICDNLTQNRGYHNVWIMLLDEKGRFESVYQAGLGKEFKQVEKKLEKGDFTNCAVKTLKQKDIVVITDPGEKCSDCPLVEFYEDRGAMTAPIIHNERLFGLITASIPQEFLVKYDFDLFQEVADDIGMALRNIMADKKRIIAERNFASANQQLTANEQQLKAANQQLTANEQQLRAANQQLMATEQQLRAANQQLTASNKQLSSTEQQLRASNQQLSASEQQLRANQAELKKHLEKSEKQRKANLILLKDLNQANRKLQNEVEQRKRKERELRSSEEFNRSIVDNSRDCIKILDLDGNLKFMSKGGQQLLEIDDIKQYLDNSWIDFWKNEDNKKAREAVEVAKMGEVGYFEGYCQTAKGTPKWWGVQISPIYDEKGNVEKLLSVSRDITERKKADEARRQSDERFRIAQDMSPDGFTILHPIRDKQDRVIDFTWIYENKAIAKINGTDPQEIVGKRLLDMFPGHRDTQFLKVYKQVAETGKSISFEEGYSDETMEKSTWFRIVVVPMDENIAILAQDITERKKAEKDLEESEEKFRLLAENSVDCVWQMDLRLRFTYISPSIYPIFGYTQEEFIGTKLSAYATRKEFFNMARKALTAVKNYKKFKHITFEAKMLKKNGETLPVEISGRLLYNEKGLPIGLQGATRDISERKEAEKKLIDSELRLREAEQIGKLGHVDWIVADQRSYWSDEIFRIYERDPKLGVPAYEEIMNLHSPEDAKRLEEAVIASLQKGKDYDLDLTAIMPSGKKKILHIIGIPVKDEKGNITNIKGTVQDITERKTAEKMIEQSLREKEVLLRELYHRTKNNMQVISSLISLRASVSKDQTIIAAYNDVNSKIKSMALVHKKLYESKNLSNIDLKEYIIELVELIQRSQENIKNKVIIILDMKKVIANIDLVAPLGLAINELVSNAFKHAFPDSRTGKLEIILYYDRNKKINLKIHDNGVAIDPKIDLRKSKSMGLQIMFQLIEYQLQGKIDYKVDNGLKWHIILDDKKFKARV